MIYSNKIKLHSKYGDSYLSTIILSLDVLKNILQYLNLINAINS